MPQSRQELFGNAPGAVYRHNMTAYRQGQEDGEYELLNVSPISATGNNMSPNSSAPTTPKTRNSPRHPKAGGQLLSGRAGATTPGGQQHGSLSPTARKKIVGTPSLCVFAGKAGAVLETESTLRSYSETAKALFVRLERVCQAELEKLFVLKLQHMFIRSGEDKHPRHPIAFPDSGTFASKHDARDIDNKLFNKKNSMRDVGKSTNEAGVAYSSAYGGLSADAQLGDIGMSLHAQKEVEHSLPPKRRMQPADSDLRSDAMFQGKNLTKYFQGVLARILLDFAQYSTAILMYSEMEDRGGFSDDPAPAKSAWLAGNSSAGRQNTITFEDEAGDQPGGVFSDLLDDDELRALDKPAASPIRGKTANALEGISAVGREILDGAEMAVTGRQVSGSGAGPRGSSASGDYGSGSHSGATGMPKVLDML